MSRAIAQAGLGGRPQATTQIGRLAAADQGRAAKHRCSIPSLSETAARSADSTPARPCFLPSGSPVESRETKFSGGTTGAQHAPWRSRDRLSVRIHSRHGILAAPHPADREGNRCRRENQQARVSALASPLGGNDTIGRWHAVGADPEVPRSLKARDHTDLCRVILRNDQGQLSTRTQRITAMKREQPERQPITELSVFI